MDLWTVAALVLLINLPFGYWRASVAKFSRPWFLAVHLPVPLVIGLRLISGLGFHLATFPVMVGAFFLGQLCGGWTRRWRAAGAVALVVVLTAAGTSCGRGKPPARDAETRAAAPQPIPAGADPESLFTALEARLLNASAVNVRYDINSDGAIVSSVRGLLATASGNRAHLSPSGTFAGVLVQQTLVSDGVSMRIDSDTSSVSVPTPSALDNALVIGLTRMGHLHNLAMLVDGQPPDHAEGGAAEWVTVANFSSVDSVTTPDPAWVTIAFDILVGGRNVAHAILWLDPATGLPAGRDQVVRFPGGEMRVQERYTGFTLDGEPTPQLFELP